MPSGQSAILPRMSKAPRILVVDDKLSIRMLLLEILGMEGYEVLDACDGLEGMKVARERKPDLIVLDLLMPDSDGETMLHTLRQDPELGLIPVIVLTARGEPDHSIKGWREWLTKPFDIEELLERIQMWVGVSKSML